MARQSISFTPPNDEWLKAQVDSEEFTSKSEVVNDLIRKAREIEFIRAKLIRAEQGGFSDLSAAEILAKSKEELRRNGEL
ncbi:MAG: CopG family transcriptional regulator [Gammaproteobacteria bacterium]|nr:CopG family transcriptional regulator [Gammaproteobacteria bacterium]